MLDKNGYRPNVGIILLNRHNQVFWGKRIREQAWQFPQGGINPGETAEQAMYRELYEEIGLQVEHVKVLGRTRDWLRYDVPNRWVRREWRGHYRGQKQIWFLLRLLGSEENITLDATHQPEFDAWRWSEYWVPLDDVIDFKRAVYLQALIELSNLLKAPPKRPANHGRILQNRPTRPLGKPVPKSPSAAGKPAVGKAAAAKPTRATPKAPGGAKAPANKNATIHKARPGKPTTVKAGGMPAPRPAAAKDTANGDGRPARPARATQGKPTRPSTKPRTPRNSKSS